MSGPGHGKRRGRGRSARPKPVPIAIRPLQPARSSVVPVDLCSRHIVQQGYAAFAARPAVLGAALLSTADITSTSPKTLAAEALVHATEGWRFLASALTALLAHSEKQAIHFAYYAELRAAVSLFASFGLRVRYPRSSYLEIGGTEGTPPWVKEPTHKLVWKLWSDWATTPSAEALFLDTLRVHPAVPLRSFKDAISQISASANLTAWGRDLQLGNEHTARNDASYNAAYTQEDLSLMSANDFMFIRDLWALAEPTAVGLQFEAQLVHWMLEAAAAEQESEGIQTTGQAGEGQAWLGRVLIEVERLTGVPAVELRSALSLDAPTSNIFDYAFSSAVDAKNIVARAFFLLRLATVAVDDAFKAEPDTLGKTWLRDWLQHAGLYIPEDGVQPADIWADFSHLTSLASPDLPLPAQLLQDVSLASDTLKLARPEAVLAWSVPL